MCKFDKIAGMIDRLVDQRVLEQRRREACSDAGNVSLAGRAPEDHRTDGVDCDNLDVGPALFNSFWTDQY